MNLPQIKVTCRDAELDLNSYDALIFSSKNSVKAIDNINKDWQKIPSFVIGNPTAKAVEDLGGVVEYISKSSYGGDFAQELKSLLENRKALFLRAKTTVSDLETILKNADIDVTSKIIYETTCRDKTDEKIPKNSVIIFTSPSTINCFFKNYRWHESFQAVCIGEVTAKALPSEISTHISKTQTIQACIELAKTLLSAQPSKLGDLNDR